MKAVRLLCMALVLGGAGFIVGCGDDKDPRISDEQAAWQKQKFLEEKYGGGTSTKTTTATVVNYVTATSTVVITQ